MEHILSLRPAGAVELEVDQQPHDAAPLQAEKAIHRFFKGERPQLLVRRAVGIRPGDTERLNAYFAYGGRENLRHGFLLFRLLAGEAT